MPRLRTAERENNAKSARSEDICLDRKLLLLFALLAALSLACTQAADSAASSAANPSAWTAADTSPTSGTTGSHDGRSAAPLARFDLIDRLPSFRKAVPRLRSTHLAGDHDAEILASDEASAYPTLGPSRALGGGAVLVEALYPAERQDVSVYFVMIKQPEGSASPWEYLVVNPDGQIQQRGALPLCDRCHAEAPHDRIFGRPR